MEKVNAFKKTSTSLVTISIFNVGKKYECIGLIVLIIVLYDLDQSRKSAMSNILLIIIVKEVGTKKFRTRCLIENPAVSR